MRNHRVYTDRLYSRFIHALQESSIEQEFQASDDFDHNLQLEKDKAHDDFDEYFNALIQKLDQCIEILDDGSLPFL